MPHRGIAADLREPGPTSVQSSFAKDKAKGDPRVQQATPSPSQTRTSHSVTGQNHREVAPVPLPAQRGQFSGSAPLREYETDSVPRLPQLPHELLNQRLSQDVTGQR